MKIPKEVITEILVNLPVQDILICSSVSKIFWEICNDERFWTRLLEDCFPRNYKLAKEKKIPYKGKILYKLIYQLLILDTITDIEVESSFQIYEIERLEWRSKGYIPKEFGCLIHLKYLDLSNNKLTEIPKEIFQLSNLEILDLSNNKLKSIPKEIEKLSNLTELHLSGNPLRNITTRIANIKNLYIKF